MTRESHNSRFGSRRHSRHGFTLVELVMVVLIIAIMTVVGIPQFGKTLQLHRADAAATRIRADLDLARNRAKMKSADHSVVFDAGANSYTLSGVADLDRSAQTYAVDLTNYPYDAMLTAANFGGNGTVVFNGFGIPDSAGTVTVQVGTNVRTVTLDANGRSTIP